MSKYIKVILISVMLFLVGCSTISKDFNKEDTKSEQVLAIANPDKNKIPYVLLIEADNYKLSKYEPQNGAYLGAYILSNKQINFDIDYFEKLAGKKHALYMYNLKLGEKFPKDWVLSCISKMKTPSIVIKPANNYNIYDKKILEKTAKEFASFDVPIFLHFYPSPATNNYDSEKYKDFYKEAHRIFKQYAPNVAFVYTIKTDEVLEYKNYYPGDNYVDWVGLNVYEKININEDSENVYGDDVFLAIDFFYYTFQKTKPIMISQLAISHYDNNKNTYYVNETQKEIDRFYNNILYYYPRIKAITYLDIDSMTLSSDNEIKDNFSITENNNILEQYKKVIENEYFFKKVTNVEENKEIYSPELIKSPFDVYKIDNEFFISEKSITYDINLGNISDMKSPDKLIGGENYYKLEIVEKDSQRRIKIDEDNYRVILYK